MSIEVEQIKQISGKQENACSCQTCKKMCRTTPCIGTPDDILKIMEAGHTDKLQLTIWCAGVVIAGIPPIQMVTPYMKDKGCAFLSDQGLCSLHDSGLKPTEGKLTNHEGEYVNSPEKVIAVQVARTWQKVENIPVITKVFENIIKFHEDNKHPF